MTNTAHADTPEVRLERATKQALKMQRFTEIMIPLLVAAIGLPLIGGVYLELFELDGGVVGALIRIIDSAPAILAAIAVISLRTVVAEYAAGRMLSAKASNGFRRAGSWAIAAFLTEMLISPVLIALLGGAPFTWQFDTLDIALMAFASIVLMIGGILEAAAAALKSENDQIV